MSGEGKYVWSTGAVFEGGFKNGLKHGNGKWRKGMGEGADVYIGEYKMDKREGYGTFTWGMTQANYRGKFSDDRMHGLGTYTWADGSTYQGFFQMGRSKGMGKITEFKTGKTYEGIYRASDLNLVIDANYGPDYYALNKGSSEA